MDGTPEIVAMDLAQIKSDIRLMTECTNKLDALLNTDEILHEEYYYTLDDKYPRIEIPLQSESRESSIDSSEKYTYPPSIVKSFLLDLHGRSMFGDNIEHRYRIISNGYNSRLIITFPNFKVREWQSVSKHLKRRCIEWTRDSLDDIT